VELDLGYCEVKEPLRCGPVWFLYSVAPPENVEAPLSATPSLLDHQMVTAY